LVAGALQLALQKLKPLSSVVVVLVALVLVVAVEQVYTCMTIL
jgi:hypothetical protein